MGVVSRVEQGVARIGFKRQAVVPVTGAVAAGGNGVSNRQNLSDSGDYHDHNHIEEVIHSNKYHPKFRAMTGRLEQPVNRR